jgi:hypothetical protein
VQDALIEDYFRYDDLSRMEADDILMNISEIESPNYEYVELVLNDKNVSTYLIGDFMSLKCLSRLLYMEPRESGSYSVPSFLSTPRKNLTIILSRSLGGICPGALSSPIEVKKSVIIFISLFVFVLVFLFKFSGFHVQQP